MKLIRGCIYVVLLMSLICGTLPPLRMEQAAAQLGAPRPCQPPAGFTDPVQILFADDTTTPRLLGSDDLRHIAPGSSNVPLGITTEWAKTGVSSEANNANEVLFTGSWAIPRTGALTFDGGRGAIVTAVAGDLVLLVCDGKGEIDTTERDEQSMLLPVGSSTPITAGTSFYVFLAETTATYWLFGNRQQAPLTGTPTLAVPESVVTIKMIGNNGGPRVCGMSNCWPVSVLPQKPSDANCDGHTCSKLPEQQGGCGGIYCWVK